MDWRKAVQKIAGREARDAGQTRERHVLGKMGLDELQDTLQGLRRQPHASRSGSNRPVGMVTQKMDRQQRAVALRLQQRRWFRPVSCAVDIEVDHPAELGILCQDPVVAQFQSRRRDVSIFFEDRRDELCLEVYLADRDRSFGLVSPRLAAGIKHETVRMGTAASSSEAAVEALHGTSGPHEAQCRVVMRAVADIEAPPSTPDSDRHAPAFLDPEESCSLDLRMVLCDVGYLIGGVVESGATHGALTCTSRFLPRTSK
ncbi:hypothetical protein ATO4_11804 [Aurantimonas sp. 22II-16-19i]|nr:hypothetical protein ATO4_11804 [Aurantimonas sp. 22II-16-19i]